MYLHVVPWEQVFGPPLASLRHGRWKWQSLFMEPEPVLLPLELEEALLLGLLGLPGGEDRGEPGGVLPGLPRFLGCGHLFA